MKIKIWRKQPSYLYINCLQKVLQEIINENMDEDEQSLSYFGVLIKKKLWPMLLKPLLLIDLSKIHNLKKKIMHSR